MSDYGEIPGVVTATPSRHYLTPRPLYEDQSYEVGKSRFDLTVDEEVAVVITTFENDEEYCFPQKFTDITSVVYDDEC